MLALAVPAIGAVPAVCPAGLHPADDGRCTGVAPRPGDLGPGLWGQVRPLGPDRAYVLLATDVDPQAPRAFVVDGALVVAPAPLPFADVVPWLGDRPDGGLVAIDVRGNRIAWLAPGASGWAPGTMPQTDLGPSAGRVEPDGAVAFVGGGADGRQVWRVAPEGFERLADLPSPRFGPRLLPGPVACGGRTARAFDAPPAEGCVRLDPGGWRAVDLDLSAAWVASDGVVYGWRQADGAPSVVRLEGAVEVALPPPTARCAAPDGPFALGRTLACEADGGGFVRYDPVTGRTRVVATPPAAWPFDVGGTEALLTFGRDRVRVARVDDRFAEEPEAPSIGGTVVQTTGGVVAVDDDRFVRWDADRQVLVAGPTLPEARHRPALAALPDGTLVVAGGTDGQGVPRLPTFRLAPGGTAWTPGPDLPEGLREPEAVALSDRSVLLAAATGAFVLDADVATPVPAPSGRLLRLADGRAADVSSSGVAILDPATLTWRTLGLAPEPRIQTALLALPDGGLLRAGGTPPDDPYGGGTTAVERMAPDGTWTPFPPLPLRFRDGWLAALPDGTLVLAGDEAQVALYDPETARWSRAAPLGREADADAPLLAFGTDALVHLGGTMSATVEVYRVTGARTAWPALPAAEAGVTGGP